MTDCVSTIPSRGVCPRPTARRCRPATSHSSRSNKPRSSQRRNQPYTVRHRAAIPRRGGLRSSPGRHVRRQRPPAAAHPQVPGDRADHGQRRGRNPAPWRIGSLQPARHLLDRAAQHHLLQVRLVTSPMLLRSNLSPIRPARRITVLSPERWGGQQKAAQTGCYTSMATASAVTSLGVDALARACTARALRIGTGRWWPSPLTAGPIVADPGLDSGSPGRGRARC